MQMPSKKALVKMFLRVVVLSVLGTAVGMYAVLKVKDWQLEREENAQAGGPPLTAENPPSPESFHPNRAVDQPPIVSGFKIVPAGKSKIEDDELVLGVEINGKARAYPINMMTGPMREIFNDELGGLPIAATW